MTGSFAGPMATMFLADLGADVIKVEAGPEGDDARSWGPPFIGSDSAWFWSVNRNKRSLSLDLRSDDGRTVLERLLASSDVFVESFSPGALQGYGLDPGDVMRRHPRLVYCAISGFGLTGSDSRLPGYDLIAQARAGLMSFTGEDGGPPQRMSAPVSDVLAGLIACFTILAAVRRQERTGKGELVDISLLEAALTVAAPRLVSYLAGGEEPRPSGATDSVIAIYQRFETLDRPIVLAIGNDKIWQRFCDVVGLEDLAADEALNTNAGRLRQRVRLIAAVQERLMQRDAESWLARFDAARIPASRIQGLSEVATDPHLASRSVLRTVADESGPPAVLVAPPWRIGGEASQLKPVPAVGQHTKELLSQLGYTATEIAHLFASGAAGQLAPQPIDPSSVPTGGP